MWQTLTPGPSPRGRGEKISPISTTLVFHEDVLPSPSGRGAGGEGVSAHIPY